MHATKIFKKPRSLITNKLRVYALYLGALKCNYVFGEKTVYHCNKLRVYAYYLASMNAIEVFKKPRTLIINKLRVYALYLGALNCNHVFGPRTVYHCNKLRVYAYYMASMHATEVFKKPRTLITNKLRVYALYLGALNCNQVFGERTVYHCNKLRVYAYYLATMNCKTIFFPPKPLTIHQTPPNLNPQNDSTLNSIVSPRLEKNSLEFTSQMGSGSIVPSFCEDEILPNQTSEQSLTRGQIYRTGSSSNTPKSLNKPDMYI
jgi:hypothetical protein